VCKTRAIVQFERGDLPIIESSRCRGCLICLPACPFGAIETPTADSPRPIATST